MLVKFAVKNYRGFADRIELDLSRPNNYEYNSFAISDGVVKNGIIYGPNGAGKSNLGLAIFDIEYHLAPLKAKKPGYYDNYEYGNTGLWILNTLSIFLVRLWSTGILKIATMCCTRKCLLSMGNLFFQRKAIYSR